ncbi:MAG: glycosyltransferase family 9 protein [Syntrophales bacterium]|nr:glycosyltransferase family 9 protein [Syntrophales bacterium]MDP3096662.1 glycosyltransferase family 9 protein [Syntrophales bacterium]
MNILIVKLSAIGDVIHTLPSLAALRRCYPDADITWVIEEEAADLLTENPDLNRVIVSGRKRWIRELRRGKIAAPLREMRSFFREIRRRPYDLVIDFHGLLKSAAIVLISGAKRKLGYDSLQEGSGLFYNEKIPEDLGKHAVDRYLDFVHYLAGGPNGRNAACLNGPPEFKISVGEEERRRVAELLNEHNAMFPSGGERHPPPPPPPHPLPAGDRPKAETVTGREGMNRDLPRFIAVNPVAFWETKLWEDEKFAELGDRLREELGIGVVLTGGESGPLERIRGRMRTEAANLGGRTTLRELACLYRQASLVVTTDSGPMHLAAAMGTPVVALFGPTDPARTGPYGHGHRVIRHALSCAPCLRKRCDDPRCMTEICVEEVFEAAREALAGSKLLI